jgi:hypothetical protein
MVDVNISRTIDIISPQICDDSKLRKELSHLLLIEPVWNMTKKYGNLVNLGSLGKLDKTLCRCRHMSYRYRCIMEI